MGEWGGGGCLFEAGRLFEVGANSRLAAYSNKYGIKLQRKKGGGIRVF